jgi:hypothetical protein
MLSRNVYRPWLLTKNDDLTSRMSHNIKNLRVIAELCIAAIIGVVWIIRTSWLDIDAIVPVPPYSYLVLLAIGFAFGCFGRSPVLLIASATSIGSMYMAVDAFVDVGGLEGFLVGMVFAGILFLMMAVVVLIGAAAGRAVKRYWLKKKARYAI